MIERFHQLTIALQRNELNDFENFHTGRNAELVELLAGVAVDGPRGVWLWGAPGRGKSHLLQAACQAAEQAGHRALYLPLAALGREAELLDGLNADVLALDDVQTWLRAPDLEARLMALYQDAQAAGARLLIAAQRSAQQSSFVLADLASRLRALPGFEVQPPSDEGLRAIVRANAGRRGLALSAAVLEFWLNRSPRSLPALLTELDALDARALSEQRRITIPLIKEVLGF